jgi:hydroxymethylbilane synthase
MRDRLIGAESIDKLPQGATVGTSSPRRAAQMKSMRPDLKIVPIRGNVETRLKKVETGEVDATLLASAGLKRLGLVGVGTAIPVEILLPAPCQGVIGIECRTDDHLVQSVLSTVSHPATFWQVTAERAFTKALGGTCHSPVAALAIPDEGELNMRAQIFSEDGSEMIEEKAVFECENHHKPIEMAKAMLDRAPESIRSLFQPA